MKAAAPLAFLPVALGLKLGDAITVASPVERVVVLLRDEKNKIEADGKSEQKVYDKFKCWCDATIIRKEKAIATGKADLKKYGDTIEKEKKNIAVLILEIDETEDKIERTKKQRETAITIRTKEHGEWAAEDAETKQAIAALVKAIEILTEGVAPPSFLQGESAHAVREGKNALEMVVRQLPQHVHLKSGQIAMLSSMVEGNYAPQSMTIQGILKDMLDTMTSSVESAATAEARSQRNHDDLLFSLHTELEALGTLLKSKNEAKAQSEANLADATQMYDNTEAQLKADTEFLKATNDSCDSKAAEWKTRKALRADELEGINKAIEILSSDDARTLFASSIKAGTEKSFLQIQSASSSSAHARRLLMKAAQKSNSARLVELAARLQAAKAGHFDEVIKAIDKMVVTLAEENKADIAKRDQCKEEYTKQEGIISNIAWLIRKNVAKIDKLEREQEKRKEEKEKTISKRKETEAYVAEISKRRKEENAAFLHAKDEDEQTIVLLTQAKDALMKYYKDNGIKMGPVQRSVQGVLVQEEPAKEPVFERDEDDAPDALISDKGKRKGQTKGILTLLQYILEDAQNEVINDAEAEKKSVEIFTEEKKTADALIEELKETTTELGEQIVNLGTSINNEENTKTDNEKEKSDEEAYLAKITPDCDWIIKNFEKRAAARTAEADGLRGAKDALVGAVE